MAATCKLCNHILCQLRCVLRFDQTSFLLRRYIGLLCSYFSSFPHTKAHVRYNLVVLLCTIQSSGFSWSLLYNIYLRATHTMILSIRGVTIPIYLVSSAMDSIRWFVVLFKSVTIPTSDPKSEFLCQSSFSCAEPTDPPEHLVRLGYLPHPRHHVSPVLSQPQCSDRVPEAETLPSMS